MNATTTKPPKDLSDAREHIPREKRSAVIEAAIKAAPDVFFAGDTVTISASTRPVARCLKDLERPAANDPNELLKNRYLCRGGGLLLVGPSGIGKSSFSMQLAVNFALGQPAFGIQPARPLKILIVQAENDDGDMAEMRDGVIAGLSFNPEQRETAGTNVRIFRDDEHSGSAFFDATVVPLLEDHKPDILFIDPAHAYHGGDASAQADVSRFLRQQLNPIIRKHNCGVAVVHHTNKPPSGKEKSTWSGSDFAYLGAGSAEWANWSRAVLAIRQHSEGIFELRAGKRGSRLGWKEHDGTTPTLRRFIRHASVPGTICWEDVPADEEPVEEGPAAKTRSSGKEDLLKLLSPSRTYRKAGIEEIGMEAGIGRARCREFIAMLREDGALHEHRKPRPNAKPEILLARFADPEAAQKHAA